MLFRRPFQLTAILTLWTFAFTAPVQSHSALSQEENISQQSTLNPQPVGTTNYTYDAVGNRLSRTSTVPGLPTQAFTYDTNDRLQSDTYDANGNTTTGKVPQPTLSQVAVPVPPETTVSDSYDFEDRLKQRTSSGANVTILYNGDGQRVAEIVNGLTVTYLVDDLNPTGHAQVVEERTNGVVTRTYTYGHDLLAQDTKNGANQWTAQYFGYDGSGSVRFLTDELGAVTDTYNYDAFGTLLASTGTTANRFRYAGEEYSPALGLYHLRARYMNAASGRFWNADTYQGTASDPLSLHKYNYAYNNPANLSDPSGHFPSLATTMCNLMLQMSFAELAGQTQGAMNQFQYAASHPNATKAELERAWKIGYAFGASTDIAFGVSIGMVFAPLSMGRAAVTIVNAVSTIREVRSALQSVVLTAEARAAMLQGLLKQGFSKQVVQEIADSIAQGGNPLGTLVYDAANKTWTSPGGLVYGQGSVHGNRVEHVLDHAVANPAKPVHSVFDVPKNKVLDLVDEAWGAKTGTGTLQSNGNRTWTVPMGRQVGTNGQTSIKIVIKDGTSEIITAFPQ